MTLILVVVFGSLGCLARWAVEEIVERRVLSHRPFATMAVNILGAAIAGFVVLGAMSLVHGGTAPTHGVSLVAPLYGSARLASWSAYLLTGFCGGFTTFSSALAIPYLDWRHGDRLRAGVLLGATPVLCVVGFWLGETLTHLFW